MRLSRFLKASYSGDVEGSFIALMVAHVNYTCDIGSGIHLASFTRFMSPVKLSSLSFVALRLASSVTLGSPDILSRMNHAGSR
jgi:hypothetical protein